jgi:hypothetical protein
LIESYKIDSNERGVTRKELELVSQIKL